MEPKQVKAIYHNSNKHYSISSSSNRYYVRRFVQYNFFYADDYCHVGSTSNYDDAMALLRADASQFGVVLKYEVD